MKRIIFILSILFFSVPVSALATKGSYVLFEYASNSYVVKHNHQDIRSIASITKLFTAYTVIKSGVDLHEKIKVNGKSSGRIPVGIFVTRLDLLRATLISSDNRAAETLANHHPGGFTKFIADVNEHALELELYNTRIVDSTGLLAGNTSTAFDLVQLLHMIKNDPVIKQISSEQIAVLKIPKGKKTITVNLRNTNPAIFTYDNILISKTGFTKAAGRCVLMLVERGRDLYAVVVLGQDSVKDRTLIVNHLMNEELDPRPSPKLTLTLDYTQLEP